MKKVLVKLNCSPYNVDIWFTNSHKLYQQRVIKIRGDDGVPEDCSGVVSSTESRGRMVIGIFGCDSSILVHELSHSVINLFHHVGMPINIDTTEAFAYMIESLYQQCTNYLNEWSR